MTTTGTSTQWPDFRDDTIFNAAEFGIRKTGSAPPVLGYPYQSIWAPSLSLDGMRGPYPKGRPAELDLSAHLRAPPQLVSPLSEVSTPAGNEVGAHNSVVPRRRRRRQERRETAPATVGSPVTARPQNVVANRKRDAKLMEQLEKGGQERKAAIDSLRGNVYPLAFQESGCRVVQQALEVAGATDAQALASELVGHVKEVYKSPTGNYVLQKVVEQLPPGPASFVAEELAGSACVTSKHRFGCRIVCRLIEHTANMNATKALVEELLDEADILCHHTFGHHVIQCVLEHGFPRQRARIANALFKDLPGAAMDRHSSYVVERALEHCSEQDRDRIVSEFCESPGLIRKLSEDQFGVFVVRQLAHVLDGDDVEVLKRLGLDETFLLASKHGRRLLEDFGLVPTAADDDDSSSQ